jgi:hypothetical protein
LTAVAEKGLVVKALENRPIILPGLDFYFSAYVDLCCDRPAGMGLSPIPWSSIINWCKLHGIHDIDDISTVIRYIRKLEFTDNEIFEKKAEKK